MVKTRVHDLAAEFGVAPEQLLSMLKDMNIFVRSHLSALESDQVSAVRVRWEREKRRTAEEPSVKKGRRKAVKAEPAPVTAEAKPTKRRKTKEIELSQSRQRMRDMDVGLSPAYICLSIQDLPFANATSLARSRVPRMGLVHSIIRRFPSL